MNFNDQSHELFNIGRLKPQFETTHCCNLRIKKLIRHTIASIQFVNLIYILFAQSYSLTNQLLFCWIKSLNSIGTMFGKCSRVIMHDRREVVWTVQTVNFVGPILDEVICRVYNKLTDFS